MYFGEFGCSGPTGHRVKYSTFVFCFKKGKSGFVLFYLFDFVSFRSYL